MKKQSFQDLLEAALPMRYKNLEKMSQKADVSGQEGAVTRGASCLASTTQRSGYKYITLDSARTRSETFLSGYRLSESPELPTAHGALSLSDSPVEILTQICCAATLPCKTDESTAVTDSVASSSEETTLANTCASVCLACGGSLPPPGYTHPGYLHNISGYNCNSCPYGMWLGGPFHVSAGGGWSRPCRYTPCGYCGGGHCGPYVPCGTCAPSGPYLPCGARTVCGSCCYSPVVPNYSPNTQNWSTFSEPIAQDTPETLDPEISDYPETPPTTPCDSWLMPKTTVVEADLMNRISEHEGVPGVECFAPEELAQENGSTSYVKPSFDNPLPSKRSKPILNRPTKLT